MSYEVKFTIDIYVKFKDHFKINLVFSDVTDKHEVFCLGRLAVDHLEYKEDNEKTSHINRIPNWKYPESNLVRGLLELGSGKYTREYEDRYDFLSRILQEREDLPENTVFHLMNHSMYNFKVSNFSMTYKGSDITKSFIESTSGRNTLIISEPPKNYVERFKLTKQLLPLSISNEKLVTLSLSGNKRLVSLNKDNLAGIFYTGVMRGCCLSGTENSLLINGLTKRTVYYVCLDQYKEN